MSQQETWRLIDTGAQDPAFNMAADEAMLQLQSEGKIPPTIRFYTWKPATLSIGYFQQVEKEVNLEALQKHGLGFVRRQTGGRSVLHDQELTYSVIVSEAHPMMPSSVTEAYRVISLGLLEGFKYLGLNAYLAIPESQNADSEQGQAGFRSAVCFDVPSWYELVVEGRKVAGSAQTRQKGVILQHGAILIDLDEDLLFEVCKFPNEQIKQRLKEKFSQRAVAINQLLPSPISLEEVKKAFKYGFEQGLKIQLEVTSLSSTELELIHHLKQTKYSTDEWNYKK